MVVFEIHMQNVSQQIRYCKTVPRQIKIYKLGWLTETETITESGKTETSL